MSHSHAGTGIGNRPQSAVPPSESRQPLDHLAALLKIENLFITIPAMNQFGLTESRIPLIYFIILGIAFLVLGYKTLIVAALIYIFYKKSNT
jgi:hypothetical protein